MGGLIVIGSRGMGHTRYNRRVLPSGVFSGGGTLFLFHKRRKIRWTDL